MSPVRAHYTNLWPIWDNYSGVEGELWKLKGGSFLKSCSATLTFFLEPIWNDWACQSEWKDEWIGEVWEWMKMTRGASSSACSGWQLAGQLERLRLPPMFHQQATTSTRAPEQAVHQSTRAAGQQGSRACQQETWLGWTIELLHTSSWTLDTGQQTPICRKKGAQIIIGQTLAAGYKTNVTKLHRLLEYQQQTIWHWNLGPEVYCVNRTSASGDLAK